MDPKRSLPPEPIVRRLSAGGSRIRNHRSHVTRPSFSAPAHVTCLTPARGKVGANENRYYEDAGRLPRNRWFESLALQRRVRVSRDFALPRREDTTTYESDVFALPGSTQKICQLTGDLDRQFMRLTGNHTELRYNLRGTDLGVSFEGDPLTNVTYFLFGDSVPIPKDDDHLE